MASLRLESFLIPFQIYNKETKTCISKVGGPCSSNGAQECIPNAICKRFNFDTPAINDEDTNNNNVEDDNVKINQNLEKYFEQCECEDGFVENINRTCNVGYGHPCSQILVS